MKDFEWDDIVNYVNEVLGKDSARPNQSYYRTLANQALRLMSDYVGPFANVWSTEDGSLEIVDNAVVFPGDLRKVSKVSYNGKELIRRNEAAALQWEITAGEPSEYAVFGHKLYLNARPSGGTLQIIGDGILPEFTDRHEKVNPLSYIPSAYQLLPAYYILSHLPAMTKRMVESGRIVGFDNTEKERQMFYLQEWNNGIAQFAQSVLRRKNEAYDGG